MPLYEYLCSACAQRFERLESFDADPQPPCPACGGTASRQLSVPALQFKGSGFYVNDYGRGSSPASTSCSAGSATCSASSSPTEASSTPCCGGKGCAA